MYNNEQWTRGSLYPLNMTTAAEFGLLSSLSFHHIQPVLLHHTVNRYTMYIINSYCLSYVHGWQRTPASSSLRQPFGVQILEKLHSNSRDSDPTQLKSLMMVLSRGSCPKWELKKALAPVIKLNMTEAHHNYMSEHTLECSKSGN